MFRFPILISLSAIAITINSQKIIAQSIAGSWSCKKIAFLKPNKDSLSIREAWNSICISLEAGGKFTTHKEIDGIKKIVATGTYTITSDGKYLNQDEIKSEIISLTDKQLILKPPMSCLMYFTKVTPLVHGTYIGTIINNKTEKPVSYASIGLLKSNTGTNADENGRFTLPFKQQDTMIVSCVGYEPLKLSLLNLPSDGIFGLEPKTATLKEVIVKNYNSKTFILNKFSGTGSNSIAAANYVMQLAQLIHVLAQNAMLISIQIHKSHEKALFRIRVYDKDSTTGHPSQDLADTVIEVNSAKSKVHIDLREYNIRIPHNDFFIAIEWIKIPSNSFSQFLKHDGAKKAYMAYWPAIFWGEKTNNNSYIPLVKNYKGLWEPENFQNRVFRISATVEY